MKIDTKARVAIDAILDVTIHGADRPVRLADISTRNGVSRAYLEHVVRLLVQGGFLASTRGPGGGYQLSRPLAVVSVADVIGAVDNAGAGKGSGRAAAKHPEDESAITAQLWSDLDEYLNDYLRTVSLESLVTGVMKATDWRARASAVARVPHVLDDTQVKDRSRSPLWPFPAH